MRTNLLYASLAALALAASPSLADAQAPARRCAANTPCDRIEDRRDRREDVRDNREDVRDRAEDRRDRREDVRDARHDGGVRDRVEDRRDRREDVRDRREDVRDRREDVRDRAALDQPRRSAPARRSMRSASWKTPAGTLPGSPGS